MISIIIAFHKGVDYLKDCLLSIKEQKYKDIETIIVVDEKNREQEENIASVFEEYKQDINLKAFYLQGSSGVAAARNLGMEKAQGEYLYFLDSDDYVLEDTLSLLAESISKEDDLSYGKIYHTWFKRDAFNIEQGDTEDDGSEKEEAAKVNNDDNFQFSGIYDYKLKKSDTIEKITALGTLYRKSFLVENNIKFNEEQKLYADVDFWVKVLCNVKKYHCSEESVYVKRYHNDELKLPSLSKCADENRTYYFVTAFLDAIEAADNRLVRSHLEFIACKYYINVFGRRFHDEGVKHVSEEFDAVSSIVKTCKKDTFKQFGWAERRILKSAVKGEISGVQKWAYLRLIGHKIVMMFTSKKHLYRTLNLYLFGKMKQRDDWIVFESFVGRNYSGQPKYIYRYLQKNYGRKYKYIWIVNDKNLEIEGNCKKVKRFSLAYYYYMTRSKFWVNNMRQPHSLPKRKSQIMLETWHGTPLKKLVFDMDDVHSANPHYKEIVYKQTRGWDYLLSDNPFSTQKFQSCFRYDKEKILELGYPANDPLYAKDLKEQSEKIKKNLGLPLDKKVLLYAPTWRDDDFYGAGEYKFNLALDLKRLKKELGEQYIVLLRMHYWVVDHLDLSGLEDFVYNVSGYSDITELYMISDICMTDYSSVFFDYANLKRPILFYMYDLEKYRDVLRGFYLDIEKELPGPILTDNDEVMDALKNIEGIEQAYRDKYNQFYERFCCIDDGNAAKRVCEKVFGKKDK